MIFSVARMVICVVCSMMSSAIWIIWASKMPGPYGRFIVGTIAVICIFFLISATMKLISNELDFRKKWKEWDSDPSSTFISFLVLLILSMQLIIELDNVPQVGSFVRWLVKQ